MRADRVDMRSGRDPVLINYRFERRSGCDNQIRIADSVLVRVHRLDWKRKLLEREGTEVLPESAQLSLLQP